MLSREGKQTDRGAVGAEFIGYNRRRREALLLQEFPHQPNCRPSVPAGLNQEIQDFALTVHGTPEIELPPSNYDDHLVQVPAFGRSWPPTLNPPRIGPTEFQDPSSNCLIREVETTLGKQVLNVPIAQRETAIEPDSMLDDDRWKAVTTVGYLAHPETLKHRPCRSHAVNVTMPFTGKETIVKDYVRERRLRRREMFVPLSHPPGHAQADFGEADAIIAGVMHRAHFFVMTLPHSDACFVAAYPAATAEAWLDGHNRAFVFFGGVPQSILYDNDKCLVSRILPDGTRQRTRAFSGLQSHYLFEDRYGRPGKGNDKGNVEGVVGYARRNFMTPLPRFASWDAFNGHLEEQCRNRQGNVLRGHRESIGERFVRDREALKRPLPAPFDACDKQGTRVNSLSLVRYRTNDYSVPVAYGHQEVWIRGYVHEVVIGCGAGIIARHPRSYERDDMVFDPIHYLPLLEHKIGALDQAAPLAGWELPDAFPTLRRLLEARMGKAGKREYVQVLRLLETFDLEVLHGAVKDALRLGAIGYDAVKHLVLCRIERRPPKLDLAAIAQTLEGFGDP